MDETEEMDFNYYSDSDDAGDEEHKRLLAAISKLDKRKRVVPSERKEPSLQVSEFHLSKGEDSVDTTVNLRHLAKSLNLDTNQVDIIRKLRATEKKTKTLPKPLEKPVAERIKREVSFKNVQKQLAQWDPIVIKNRVSDDLVFPLNRAAINQINPKEFLDPNQGATELEREIAAVLNGSESVQKEREEEEEFPLSLEEMVKRRKELARLRVHESYRNAKAHRQNKIKSKKFHRYERRECIRKQIKEFEELQEKDPEAALERLAEIEKQRVLERASLRHRSTGKWAQNHAVRAKYDKESRQVLSEQLQINKDLTQKIQVDSESSEDEAPDNNVAPSDNPWMSQTKTEEDIDAFLSGYRKYWEEKGNKSKENPEEAPSNGKALEASSDDDIEEVVLDPKAKALMASAVESYSEIPNAMQKISKPQKLEVSSKALPKGKKELETKSEDNKKLSSVSKKKLKTKSEDNKKLSSVSEKKPKTKSEGSKKLSAVSTGGSWTVTPLETSTSDHFLHHMFDDLNEKMTAKAQKKIAGLKAEMGKDVSKKRRSKAVDPSSLLELKRQKLKIDLDEKLDEGTGDSPADDAADQLAEKIKLASSLTSESKKSAAAPELDPKKFMKTAQVKLKTALPDEITGGDEGLDDSDAEGGQDEKHLTISEAFADDDVVADFSQEKQDAIEKDKPEDINLVLPGWGSWGGHNLKPSKRKQRRFMVKMPEAPPRRDENKGNLIINENEDKPVREHQVSNLPFPFTSVKDYEASVRAPIGNTFIPQTAHRKLIKPSVSTKMGAIITPMDKEELVKMKKK
ncbi:U3 small nucleolar RNA-associated protein 14 homolog A [Thrips palmi]|uniref:U3 small nucleolar RNA-associated protein 14 homolog A n=1 Tax=Thrips palmi TaxID=161013 RepID=A0A6P8Z9I6_THRPL|nr:U3 small nucleolar RNA-associated protein 14 homolog A [Thrips palmi]